MRSRSLGCRARHAEKTAKHHHRKEKSDRADEPGSLHGKILLEYFGAAPRGVTIRKPQKSDRRRHKNPFCRPGLKMGIEMPMNYYRNILTQLQ
jgi:hypothetical protein